MRLSGWLWITKSEIEYLFRKLNERISRMNASVDRLTREVGEMRTSVSEAATKIADLVQQIRDNTTDPAVIEGLADELDQLQTDLANAGTPPEEPTQPETPNEDDNA